MSTQKRTHPLIIAVLSLFSLACLIPFWLVLMISIADEKEVLKHGYSFWPQKFSFVAYQFLAQDAEKILRAYGVSIFVTVIGVVLSLFVTSAMAFSMSRKDFPLRGALSIYILITMLFSGGLLPWYLVYTRFLHVQDTLLALIIPGLIGGFNVIIMRTFFTNSIPPSLIDSAQIDGASEYRTYFSIILPLSLPVMATIGLFITVSYWNDWFTSLVFIQNEKLFSLQYLLNKTLMNASFLQSIANKAYSTTAQVTQPLESIRMAMAMIAIGPLVLVFPFLQKYFVKGLTVGAVKG
ncbi:carbohydrate ABC transporter permease [Paenibacillus sp. 7124]|uniref:Carbohydrate ABC transporter permease n=1 Tax=Paenibacillus apii TaxID=1850370 RepID=A0A6M1PKZ8_9BACL|nr:carbohydrate ABC transporter permease [Paenibacillus apii]NGM83886.1 carbohydrate ABC transporter permease [Paenibacillus apii]NJJ40596.1 carbohydrate ABC transporter permease [Paenibacillus apii]